MSYFVTGASGFIGRRLVAKLLERKGTVYILMRKGSLGKLDAMRESWGDQAGRVKVINGDLAKARMGVSRGNITKLKGKIKHVFHLAAIYDLTVDADAQYTANVEGTRNAVRFASAVDAGCFHHVSSIAAAGLYGGIFREDMFEEAENLEHPYFRTKHDSEAVVRNECATPWRVYRPGMVVGDSQTGEMDKIDGPYYFFKLIQRMRNSMPAWMPTIGIEGGRINVVPVDYVVDALDYIAHVRGEDGGCFHLTDPEPRRIGEVLNLFAKAAHAPQMTMRLNARMFGFVPSYVWKGVAAMPPVRRVVNHVLSDLGLPKELMGFINYPTRFDARETERVLRKSGIRCPDLADYAWVIWDYWERHLDPDLFVDRSLGGKVRDRVVVITGGSSGIGLATAVKVAEAGAITILVARGAEALEEARKEIADAGHRVFAYSADLSDMDSIDALIATIQDNHGPIDILINNAGRSIRRGIERSFDRFHDFERTMQLNYFGALRTTMQALPAMIEQKRGHIVNISSIGVLSNAPRFSAYVASKAALDAFTRCAAAEFSHRHIHFTTINMPLVRTPMIAPTKMYQNVPTISPEEAAEMVTSAIIRRPKQVATRLGIFAQISYLLFPKAMELSMNTAFQMFPDSSAARGDEAGKNASTEQIALAQLTKGIHW
jgi:NAD(P)-dependent dehydrogenase (short-subunit alcohol dehydrogenase family)